jgi:pilus assembly protein Flp/PilA
MGLFMRNIIKFYLVDESGAAAAEYALILAIVGAGIATAAIALGSAISGALHSASTTISGYTY